jgi:predicted nucleotidyltransferase
VPLPPLEELLARLRAALEDRSEVLEAYLFGSRARDEAAPHSDVDVAVTLDREAVAEPPFGHAARLAADLMAALDESRVDVVVLNDASPLLYHRVLRDGVRILSRDLRATTTREGRALSRYCDYVPQLSLIDAAHSARILRGDYGR